ncbi:hypothetical protein [Xanthomonas arboricola]|uniref:hypothetical protein n=1 Tax=Xanthomonas arboricola TaxID=56448 RepID=UPI000E1F4632|nr:hypothetical protein [Xanthomonas arboricola]
MIKFAMWPKIGTDLRKALSKIRIKDRPDRWDGQTEVVKMFKAVVKAKGLEIQSSRCAWCTLTVGDLGRRSAHRDHIAPKRKHPAWTFLPQNIVISCEFCNGFNVKKDVETIEFKVRSYAKCTFFIVHPYFDNPSDHLEFVSSDDDTQVIIKGKSGKGTWTIRELKLDSPGATFERAKDCLYRKRLEELSNLDQELLKSAVSRLGD